MDRDIAVRLASTDVDDLTVAKARQFISAFLTRVATCSRCEGAGTFLPADRSLGRTGCPFCAGTGRDPAVSTWHCVADESAEYCSNARRLGKEQTRALHADCGLRVMIPLDEPEMS